MKEIYIVTRVDVDYCSVCEVFNTREEAIDFIKTNFYNMGLEWNNRFSMIMGNEDKDEFPIRECEGGNREWDIHYRMIRN